MKQSTKVVLGGLAISLLIYAGGTFYVEHFPSWHEEVRLHDGRVITVLRQHTINMDGDLTDSRVKFKLPETGQEVEWNEPLYPAIVDVYQGRAYVVGDVRGSLAKFGAYRAPRYLYVAFVSKGSTWRRIPYMEVPEVLRRRENISSCLLAASKKKLVDKQIGWCGSNGQWDPEGKPDVDLAVRSERAERMLRLIDGRVDRKFGSD